jgi:hypothetical protein
MLHSGSVTFLARGSASQERGLWIYSPGHHVAFFPGKSRMRCDVKIRVHNMVASKYEGNGEIGKEDLGRSMCLFAVCRLRIFAHTEGICLHVKSVTGSQASGRRVHFS